MNETTLQNKHVLIVEDDTINQLVARHIVEKMGGRPEVAESGVQAIELFYSNTYDLVLMDLQLPGMDGYDTTAYIRQHLKNDIPIIAMTASALPHEEQQCLDKGMNGYLSKPFTIEKLASCVAKVFKPNNNSTTENVLTNGDVVVDLTLVYEISGNDAPYINTLVKTFTDNMPGNIALMEQQLEQQDFLNLSRSAHHAKSSLSVIKISNARETVEKIEKTAAKAPDVAELKNLLQHFKQMYTHAEALLVQKFGMEKRP